MTIDRNHPRWTAYVLGELEERERAEFETEMDSTSDAEAILAETRDAVTLLREGFAAKPPVYLSAGQKRALEAEVEPGVPWFRNRLHWAMGGAAAAIVLLGVVTITVPNLLRSRQATDRIESVNGGQESSGRVTELARLEPITGPDIEAVRTTESENVDGSRLPVPSKPAAESPRVPRRIMTRIEGQITDHIGAVIPGVEVTVTSDNTGQFLRDVTDDTGKFNVAILRLDSYTVETEFPGFKATTRREVQVQRERNTRLDLTLQPGDISYAQTMSGRRGVMGALALEAPLPPPPPPPPAALIASRANSVGVDRPVHGVIDRTRFNTEEYDRIVDNPFVAVRDDPLATFSIDVDTASYANVRRFLNDFTLPPRDAVRIEEMVNYFRYDYAGPTDGHPVRIHAEVSAAPWTPEHRLVRLGVQGRKIPLEERAPSNLVFLIDVSGSMEGANKLPLLKNGMKLLVKQLGQNDRVAVVVYAGAAGMVLPSTPGDQKRKLLGALDRLAAGGSTNGGAGIELAYDTAVDHFIKGGTNRVILATDGDFNVGVSDHGALTRLIEEKAETGVFLSVLGFGTGNYNDAGLEALAQHGNGNYAYIDSIREARKVFVEQLGSTLITIAKDVKIQVEFNPAQANAYRLIGYENRVLEHPDFNDDTKDAGEIGSGHTVTVLLEVVPTGVHISLPGVDPLKYQTPSRLSEDPSPGELLTVKVRYKEPDGEVSRRLEVAVVDKDVPLAEASTDYRFAAAVAGFGMILRDSPHKGRVAFDSILRLSEANLGRDEDGYRAGLVELVRKASAVSLHAAAKSGNPAVVETLLGAGADPQVRDTKGETPLYWAVRSGHTGVIEALLAAGADLKAQGVYGDTPLHFAARDCWNSAVIQTLLAAGADPKVRDRNGHTPLHWAAKNESPVMIEVLLTAGADLKAQGSYGDTPLHWAAGNENPKVIEALLTAGADAEAQNEDGYKPLHVAAGSNENPAVIKALLAAGADPKVRDANGATPLHWAGGSNENPAVIKALLAAGADVKAQNIDGHTALQMAVEHNENRAVQEILRVAGSRH